MEYHKLYSKYVSRLIESTEMANVDNVWKHKSQCVLINITDLLHDVEGVGSSLTECIIAINFNQGCNTLSDGSQKLIFISLLPVTFH